MKEAPRRKVIIDKGYALEPPRGIEPRTYGEPEGHQVLLRLTEIHS